MAVALPDFLAAASLSHLISVLADWSCEVLMADLQAMGRPGFLKALKERGVDKLVERQKLATLIAKVAKGEDVVAAASGGGGSKNVHLRWCDMEAAKDLIGSLTLGKALTHELSESLPALGKSPLLPGEPSDGSKLRPTARVRLIALYGTGHDATHLASWQTSCPPWLEMRVVELPGHGARSNEALWSLATPKPTERDWSDAQLNSAVVAERAAFVATVVGSIKPLVEGGEPYALYGFSSGALLSYLIALELGRRRLPTPFRLFVCGRAAPHCVWDPNIVRTYRTGDEDAMEALLLESLAVMPLAEAEKTMPKRHGAVDVTDAAGGVDGASAVECGSGGGDDKSSRVPVATILIPLSERIARKNSAWRAPLLTAAVCVGDPPATPADGPYYSVDDRRNADPVARMQHMNVQAAAWIAPCPLVVMASSGDRVWPLTLTRRWDDVAPVNSRSIGGGVRMCRFVEFGNVSHFKLMDHEHVRDAVVSEMAAAARAFVGL